jgi:hypothetical protein
MKIVEFLFDIWNKHNPIPGACIKFMQECLLTELRNISFDYEPRGHFEDFGVSNASNCTMIT